MLLTKVAHQSANFQTSGLIKIYRLCYVIFETRASFSSNFASLFSVMRNNASVLFHEKLYIVSAKGTHQVQIFRLSTARMKINQIPCHFSSQESVLT